MPTTLTLKNIPDALYERLKQTAGLHRRSLNSEAIMCLESVLLRDAASVAEQLARIAELRSTLPQDAFHAEDIDALKRDGRL